MELTTNTGALGYQRLLEQISGTFSQGQARAAQVVNTILIDTYWQVGQYIVEFDQAGLQRATYGEALLFRELELLMRGGLTKGLLIHEQ